MTRLRVGVVLPVYNGAAFLPEALASIAAQNLNPVDIVAVDDGSLDGSAELLERFGARVLRTDRVGPALARDTGIRAVAGDLVACLDQDDRWRPTKLARQVAVMAAEPHTSFVGALCTTFLEPGTERPDWWKPAWDRGAADPSLAPSATLYRRSAFERAGGFADSGVRISEDVAWTARAHDLGLLSKVLDEILVERRIHGNNTSADQNLRVREHLAIVRESLARRRSRGLANVHGDVPNRTGELS
jgi:glycosyltransferase involved in cell wall biosynthesis